MPCDRHACENAQVEQNVNSSPSSATMLRSMRGKVAPVTPAPAASTPSQPAAASTDLRAISTPSPRYPPDAYRAGTKGEVQVEFTVGTNGAVTSARVVRATPARVFDREALSAVKRWRFQPVAAPVTTRRTIGFDPGT